MSLEFSLINLQNKECQGLLIILLKIKSFVYNNNKILYLLEIIIINQIFEFHFLNLRQKY